MLRARKGWPHPVARVCGGLIAVLGSAFAQMARAEPLPLDEFSPAFLGMYRKVMEIEDEIRRHAQQYGVDFDLARAVCMYESGGDAGLTSHAGAQGYFQVMPATFRELRVTTNIEAGVKYLAQLTEQFGREDRAVAAYNAGPGRVGRAGGLPLETLQYVVGVGHYRTVLKEYDASLRHHAGRLGLAAVGAGEDWTAIAARLGIPVWELRLHNPFLAGRRLRVGHRIAYPTERRSDLLELGVGGAAYRTRHGDNHIKLAIMLGVDVEALRAENGLWQTQVVPAGVVLRIPLAIDRGEIIRAALSDRGLDRPNPVPSGAPLVMAHQATGLTPPVAVVRPPAPAVRSGAGQAVDVSPWPGDRSYRVKAGDTLTSIARRHRTTVSALQQANNLRGATIRIGQLLRIPPARPQV